MGLFLSTLGVPLPQSGTVLGGTMELHGKNISLACFHGINFKVCLFKILKKQIQKFNYFSKNVSVKIMGFV